MPRYWVVRTDRHHADSLIAPELRRGRLRQGWGYRADQDLRLIRDRLASGVALDWDQNAAWRHGRRLLPDADDSIHAGDRLLLPNLPRVGRWSVAEAGDDYDFAIASNTGDHGHIRAVALIREDLDPNGFEVSARLRRTMRCQRSTWNVDPHGRAIEGLLAAYVGRPTERDPLDGAFEAVLETFWRRVSDAYGGAELEAPVQGLLEELFDQVDRRAGAGEHGADFLCRRDGPLGERHLTAVQLKMWEGNAVDTRPLDQLRTAYAHWPGVTSCAVITTAEGVHPAFERARRELEEELAVPVEVVSRTRLLSMFVGQLVRRRLETRQ